MSENSFVSTVVDEWGYLWTNSGTFIYNGTDTKSYSVLRFNTDNMRTGIIYAFSVDHETNVSASQEARKCLQICNVPTCPSPSSIAINRPSCSYIRVKTDFTNLFLT